MSRVLDLPDVFIKNRTFGFFDDFFEFITGDTWEKVVTDVAGGVGIVTADGAGGILTVGTEDATDNDEVYLRTTNEVFKFAAAKPAIYEIRAQYSEANTDDANVYYGFMDAIAADALVDNGAGPKTSGSHAGFYKVDGGTTWIAHSSNSTTQTATTLSAANSLDKVLKTAGGASYQTLRILYLPTNSTSAEILFYIDSVHVARHTYTFTSATEMQAGVGLKNGGANAETVLVDYIAAYQLR